MRADKVIIYCGIFALFVVGASVMASVLMFIPEFFEYEVAFRRGRYAYMEQTAPGKYKWTQFGSYKAYYDARMNAMLTFLLALFLSTPFFGGGLEIWEGHKRAEWLAKAWKTKSKFEPSPYKLFKKEHRRKPSLGRKVIRYIFAVLCFFAGILGFIVPILLMSSMATTNNGETDVIGVLVIGGVSIAISVPFLLSAFMIYKGRNQPKKRKPLGGVFPESVGRFSSSNPYLGSRF